MATRGLHPRPFTWAKDADEVLAKIERAKTKQTLLHATRSAPPAHGVPALPPAGRELFALGRRICREPKDIYFASHRRAHTNEVETPKVKSDTYLHRLNARIAKQLIEWVPHCIKSERPSRHTECGNSPIIKPTFTIETGKNTVAAEA
jgi:hypothetical protein